MNKIILWSEKHPFLVVLFVIIVSVLSARQLPYIKIDPTIEKLLSSTHPEKVFYHQTEHKFTSDIITSIYIKDENLFTVDKIEKLEKLTWKLVELSEVQKVESLYNSPNFFNEDGMLSTVPLFDPAPDEQKELDRLMKIGLNNPLFVNQFISPDLKSMTIIIYAIKGKQEIAFYKKLSTNIDNLIAPLQGEFERMHQIGVPKLSVEMSKGMLKDQKTMLPIGMFIVALCLFLMIKSINASILPILTGGLSLLWTLGFMVAVDIPAQMLISTVPIILFIIGSTEDCHILAEYMEGLKKKADRSFAISYYSKKVSLAITLTSLTTIIGFLSITLNEIVLLKEFAVVASAGLLFNFIVTATIIPVYLKFFGESKPPSSIVNPNSLTERMFANLQKKLIYILEFHRRHTATVVIIFIFFGIGATTLIRTDIDNIKVFPEKHPFRVKIDQMNENFEGGINNFLLVLKKDGDKPFKKSINMRKVFEIHQWVNGQKDLGIAQSLAGTLALINREMHDSDPYQYRIPDNDNLISQYMLFLSKDDWEAFVTPDFKEVNLIVRHKMSSSIDTKKALAKMSKKLDNLLEGTGITYRFTSKLFLQTSAAQTLVSAQVEGLLLILTCIFFLIAILYKSFKIALISLVPNIIPIIGIFSVMGITGIPLDIGTCLIATIAIGVATDDTIHFFTRFNDEMRIHNDSVVAAQETLKHEIRPIVTTSVSLTLGLGILGFSNFVPLIEFGVLAAVTMFFALISDLIVTPALLIWARIDGAISIYEIMTTKVSPSILSNSVLFKDMNMKDCKYLTLMGRVRTFNPNDTDDLFTNRADSLFIILEGQMKLIKKAERSGDDVEHIDIAKLSSGASYGQGRVQGPHYVKALSYVRVLEINTKFITRVEKKRPDLARSLRENLNVIMESAAY
ncbi:MAG: MMPL family transporter [Bacteriovoracaceae bacterium]|nr:MMPL family transporter [Bacteriovoracaceae bacterium]